MRAAIVIASRTPRFVRLCLAAHALYTPPEVAIVVVENSDREGDYEEMVRVTDESEFPLIDVLRYASGPRFYGQFANAGVGLAMERWNPDWIVLQNDDTVVMPDWLDLMTEDAALVEKHGYKLGMLGACSNAISGPQANIGNGWPYRNGPVRSPVHCPRLVPILGLIHPEAWKECGGFDDGLLAHNFTDEVLSYRMMKVGRSNWLSRAFVAHAGSRSLKQIDGNKDMAEGWAYRSQKYPDYDEVLRSPPVRKEA